MGCLLFPRHFGAKLITMAHWKKCALATECYIRHACYNTLHDWWDESPGSACKIHLTLLFRKTHRRLSLGMRGQKTVQLLLTHWCRDNMADIMETTFSNLTHFSWKWMYRKVSNIRRTKCQHLNDSCLVLQLSVPNPLKPSVKSIMKM